MSPVPPKAATLQDEPSSPKGAVSSALIIATPTFNQGCGAIKLTRKYHQVGFTAAKRAELWGRSHNGESLHAIGRELGKPSSSIFAHLRPTCGISPAPTRTTANDETTNEPGRMAQVWTSPSPANRTPLRSAISRFQVVMSSWWKSDRLACPHARASTSINSTVAPK